METFVRASIAYATVALILYAIAPDYCSGLICFFSKELVVVFSLISYLVICAMFVVRHIFIHNKEILNSSNAKHIDNRGLNVIHLAISSILSPVGALIFIIMIDGFDIDEFLENTIGIICFGSSVCRDVGGDLILWASGILISFSITFFIPRMVIKLL